MLRFLCKGPELFKIEETKPVWLVLDEGVTGLDLRRFLSFKELSMSVIALRASKVFMLFIWFKRLDLTVD